MSFVSLDVGPGPSSGLAMDMDTLHWGNMKHATLQVFLSSEKSPHLKRKEGTPIFQCMNYLHILSGDPPGTTASTLFHPITAAAEHNTLM